MVLAAKANVIVEVGATVNVQLRVKPGLVVKSKGALRKLFNLYNRAPF